MNAREWIENLRAQAKSDQVASQRLAEQARRGQEVSRVLADQDLPEQDRRRQEADQILAQESMEAYADFLDSLFSYRADAEASDSGSHNR